MITKSSTIQIDSDNNKKRKLLSLLSKKNKVLIDFYRSFIFLETSLDNMNKSIDQINETDEKNNNDLALGLILKEAYSMNEIFTRVVQSTCLN